MWVGLDGVLEKWDNLGGRLQLQCLLGLHCFECCGIALLLGLPAANGGKAFGEIGAHCGRVLLARGWIDGSAAGFGAFCGHGGSSCDGSMGVFEEVRGLLEAVGQCLALVGR